MNSVARPHFGPSPFAVPVPDAMLETLGAAATEAPSPLVRLLTIARRRRWVILGAIGVALLLGLLITLLMTPAYTASATLEIQQEGRNFTQVQGADTQNNDSGGSQEFYQTEYGLLQARSLAERVASDLHLQDSSSFFALFRVRSASGWFDNGHVRPYAPPREQRVRAAAGLLLKHFQVDPLRGSRLVQINFTSPDPAFSKRVVDAWSVNFVRATLDRHYEATSYAREFLEDRLGQLRQRIDSSERQLVDYATREGIVNLPGAVTTGTAGSSERSIVAENLDALNQELSRATADRVRAQSRLGEAADATPEALTNGPIATLRQRLADMQVEMSRLLIQFDPQYPAVRTLRTQMDRLQQAITREESRVGSSINLTYKAALDREQELNQRVNDLKTGLLDFRRRSIQYNILQRDVDTNRQLYDALLQRYKEIGVAGGVGVNNISVVDVADTPSRPSSPRPVLNLLLALLGGLFAGGVVAFFLEQVDRGISEPEDVEPLLGTPLIGTIPRLATGSPVDALVDRKSALSEAYTSLRANLAFSTDHGLPRVLAVSSSRPAEGKTTTSYALALSIARNGRRVVLVDADMRSPSVHGLFGFDNRQGLSNFLAGSGDPDEMVRSTSTPELSVISAGPHPPSAPELLSSDRFAMLLKRLGERFDHIVIDAPPVMGLADAPLIASRAEGMIFVIESASTHRSLAAVAVNRLRASNAQIVGAVLTKFDARRAHFGYGYESGYGYGYGDNLKSAH